MCCCVTLSDCKSRILLKIRVEICPWQRLTTLLIRTKSKFSTFLCWKFLRKLVNLFLNWFISCYSLTSFLILLLNDRLDLHLLNWQLWPKNNFSVCWCCWVFQHLKINSLHNINLGELHLFYSWYIVLILRVICWSFKIFQNISFPEISKIFHLYGFPVQLA